MSKKIIQVYLDLDSENGCWNCKHDIGGICEVNLIGAVSYLIGISHCALKNWENGDGEITLWKEEVIATLNELQDENEQLNEENKSLRIGENEIILKQETTINKLLKENKQLKIELKGIEKENHMLNGKVNRLTDELANCYEKLGW